MYCDTTDVELYFQNQTFDLTSYVSVDQIRTFITVETAMINTLLKKRYTLPITNISDLLILKMICEKLVVGTVDDIIREKNTEGDVIRSRGLRKEAMDWLNKIASGEITLYTTGKTSVIKFNNTDSNGDEVEKEFKIGNVEPTNDILDRETHTVIRTS